MNLKNIFKDRFKGFLILAILQAITIYSAYFVITIKSGNEIFLISDGYYEYAAYWFKSGKIDPANILAPGLPSILTVLFFFPEESHPFLRVTISLIFSIAALFMSYKISKKYLSPGEFFFGGLIFSFSILYVQWILKLTPEIFLAFFLGVYIFYLQKYFKQKKWKYIGIANLVLIVSIFTKPVFIFIPFFLLLYSLFRKKLLLFSVIGIIVCLVTFKVYSDITSFEPAKISKTEADRHSYNNTVKYGFIWESYWYDFMIRTKQFHKGLKVKYREGTYYETSSKEAKIFIKNYFDNNPEGNMVTLYMTFFKQKTWIAIQKIITVPLFYFMLGTIPKLTYILIPITLISWFLMYFGLKKVIKLSEKEDKEFLLLLFIVLLGYSMPYLIFHAYSRYSMPMLPFLYVWAGAVLRYYPLNKIGLGRTEIKAN